MNVDVVFETDSDEDVNCEIARLMLQLILSAVIRPNGGWGRGSLN